MNDAKKEPEKEFNSSDPFCFPKAFVDRLLTNLFTKPPSFILSSIFNSLIL